MLIIISNSFTSKNISNLNLFSENLYVLDFNEIYIKNNKCVALNKRRIKYDYINVFTKKK